jgi:hypothetical protein
MKDRGMVKWAPYKSLCEQEDFMTTMHKKKNAIAKPRISSDKAEEINSLLTEYKGQNVAVQFFLAGSIKESRGEIQKIDTFYKFIEMNDIRISFSDIVDAYEC